MVEVTGRQLDQCEVCGEEVHKRDLVRTNMDFLANEASNYLLYSSYNSSGWSTSGLVDAGVISIGPYGCDSRVRVGDDNSLTEVNGSQTWTGDSGYLYSTSAIDASTWTSLTFAADCGPYQQSTAPTTVFTLSLCNSDGTNPETLNTFTTLGSIRAWGTINIADLPAGKSAAALYFRIDAAPSTGEKWWVDRMQVAKDKVNVSAFAPTSGASVDRNDTSMMTVRKVCSSCREPLLKKSERFNKNAEQRTDAPVAVDIQEI